MSTSQDSMACEFCGESIPATAIRCMHCRQYVDGPNVVTVAATEAAVPRCAKCIYQPTSAEDAARHKTAVHVGPKVPSKIAPGYKTTVKRSPTKKQKVSEVGTQTGAGLACPKCGGVQFKVKRSGARKLGAVVAAPITIGASALILAKGTQVKCVTCGTVYKRG